MTFFRNQSFTAEREEEVENASCWQEWLVHWRTALPVRRSSTSCRNMLTGISWAQPDPKFLACDALMKSGQWVKKLLCIKGPKDFWALIHEKQTEVQLRKMVLFSLEYRKVRKEFITVFHYLQAVSREDAAFSSQRHTEKRQDAMITSYNRSFTMTTVKQTD